MPSNGLWVGIASAWIAAGELGDAAQDVSCDPYIETVPLTELRVRLRLGTFEDSEDGTRRRLKVLDGLELWLRTFTEPEDSNIRRLKVVDGLPLRLTTAIRPKGNTRRRLKGVNNLRLGLRKVTIVV
jgi:hypothetical protein